MTGNAISLPAVFGIKKTVNSCMCRAWRNGTRLSSADRDGGGCTLQKKDLLAQARKADIDYQAKQAATPPDCGRGYPFYLFL